MQWYKAALNDPLFSYVRLSRCPKILPSCQPGNSGQLGTCNHRCGSHTGIFGNSALTKRTAESFGHPMESNQLQCMMHRENLGPMSFADVFVQPHLSELYNLKRAGIAGLPIMLVGR